jgi:hypothetical protein
MPQCWFVTQSQTGGLYHIKLPVYLRELLVHKTGMRRHGACKLVDRFWTVFFFVEIEDFPTVCTDPPRATRRVKPASARNIQYNHEYKSDGCSDY